MNSMEYELNGRQPQWQTTSMENYLNGRFGKIIFRFSTTYKRQLFFEEILQIVNYNRGGVGEGGGNL